MENSADWFARAEKEGFVHADVRPILDAGGHPLQAVLTLAQNLPDGGWLVIDVHFDPIPMRAILADEGFPSVAEQRRRGHWRVCFHRTM